MGNFHRTIRLGNSMKHADTLTRYPVYIAMNCGQRSEFLYKLKTTQREDAGLQAIKSTLEDGKQYKHLFMKHEILHRNKGEDVILLPKKITRLSE